MWSVPLATTPSAEPPAPSADPTLYAVGWTQTGIASWYGEPFHGRTTAAGNTYDMDAISAAHRTIPFGTRIRVDNLDNGRSIDLDVTDRGPFVRGRILDVSRGAARELEMIGPGTARVRITVTRNGDPGLRARRLRRRPGRLLSGAPERRGQAAGGRAGGVRSLDRAVREACTASWPAPSRMSRRSGRARETFGGFLRRC